VAGILMYFGHRTTFGNAGCLLWHEPQEPRRSGQVPEAM